MSARKIDWTGERKRLGLSLPARVELPPHISIDEAAEILGVKRHLIDTMIATNRIPVIYAGSVPPPEPEPRFYTRQQAAEILQVSMVTLDAAIDTGVLPALRLSERTVRISAKALIDYAVKIEALPET